MSHLANRFLLAFVYACMISAEAGIPVTEEEELTTSERASIIDDVCPANSCLAPVLPRDCNCDASCDTYGDCCSDSPYLNNSTMSLKEPMYDCVSVARGYSVFLITDCPKGWIDEDISELCARFSLSASAQEKLLDSLLYVPVTSVASNISYANFYCSTCHADSSDVKFWSFNIACYQDSNGDSHFNQAVITETTPLKDYTSKDLDNCEIGYYPTGEIQNSARPCRKVIDSCHEDWADTDLEVKCKSFLDVRYDVVSRRGNASKMYKNKYCVLCNNVNLTTTECSTIAMTRIFDSPIRTVRFSVTVLFDSNNKCGVKEIWDPFAEYCRSLVCHKPGEIYSDGKCVVNCTNQVILNRENYVLYSNETVLVPEWDKTFDKWEFHRFQNGIIACLPEPKFVSVTSIITVIGLTFSCICLLVFFILYFSIPTLRNLPGNILVSLSLSLFGGYVSFLLSAVVSPGTPECVLLAFFVYFFYILAFSWMNVLAYNYWKTMHYTKKHLRLSSGKQWKTYIKYFFYSLSFALIFEAFMLVVHLARPGFMDDYHPNLGIKLCWFNNKRSQLILFVLPVAAMVVASTVFFVLTLKIVLGINSAKISTAPHPSYFRIAFTLFIYVGLTWALGIVAGIFDLEFLWYIYAVLVSFHGMFILVCYLKSKKNWKEVQKVFNFISVKAKPEGDIGLNKSENVDTPDTSQVIISN